MTEGQSTAIRALTYGFYSLCAELEQRGLVSGADIAATLRRFDTRHDPHLMETVEALAANLGNNPFGPGGAPLQLGVIDGGKQD